MVRSTIIYSDSSDIASSKVGHTSVRPFCEDLSASLSFSFTLGLVNLKESSLDFCSNLSHHLQFALTDLDF